ncbi:MULTISPECIES: TrbC/VirB2 family protein [unclassified Sporosarcina]|uniref:TrbC/VirB2 family protein n=1 Tax=unclassified Sporosarcina TaxID=2647733 RepID=UPI001A91EE77|nr:MULTISPECIES: TrbC/VirB2 family protein [unclassified Sporosarcina]MBO0588398.1 hypothetical protein [Sporosarcina sp. E16_8]MBO0601908.1 hypothetical protein [Sporosarcina sp. E16_3]
MNELMNRVTLLTINGSIYTGGGNNEINAATMKIIKMVGGIGGALFTLAILIIAIFIIFGSISSRQIGTVWKALFSCIGGALLFYSAYFLAPAIQGIVGG